MALHTEASEPLPAGHRPVLPPAPERPLPPSAPSKGGGRWGAKRLIAALVALACTAFLAGRAVDLVREHDRTKVRTGPAVVAPAAGDPAPGVAPGTVTLPAEAGAEAEAGAVVPGPVAAAPTAAVPVAKGSVLVAEAGGALHEVAPDGVRTARGVLPFGDVRTLALSPDRTQVYVGAPHGTGASAQDVYRFALTGHGTEPLAGELLLEDVTAFALRPDGTRLAWAVDVVPDPAGTGATVLRPARIHELDLASGASVGTWAHRGYELQRIVELSYSADGRTLAYVATFEAGQLWVVGLDGDGSDGRWVQTTGTNTDVRSVGWWPAGSLLAATTCCVNEGSRPTELVVLDPTGEVDTSRSIEAPSARIVTDPSTGLVLLFTDHLERREPDGGALDLGPATAASF